MTEPIRINESELHAAQREAGMWDAIDALCAQAGIAEDDCPADAISAVQYAEHRGVSKETARAQLKAFVRAGKLKTGNKVMPDARGHKTLTAVYWPA